MDYFLAGLPRYKDSVIFFNNTFYFIGGILTKQPTPTSPTTQTVIAPTNEVHKLNVVLNNNVVTQQSFTKLDNAPFSPRYSPNLLVFKNYLYVFGGFSATQRLTDVWRMDGNENWERVSSAPIAAAPPMARPKRNTPVKDHIDEFRFSGLPPKSLLDRVKLTLQEVDGNGVLAEGVRWSNAELVMYLNEAYQFILSRNPDASVKNAAFKCRAGARQTLPVDGVKLIDVNCNLDGNKTAINTTTKRVMDTIEPTWRNDEQSYIQELFLQDDLDPYTFFVYPPAKQDSLIEIVYSFMPPKHDDYHSATDSIALPEKYHPIIINYILSCCYAKDGDDAGNANLAVNYLTYAEQSLDRIAGRNRDSSINNPGNDL